MGQPDRLPTLRLSPFLLVQGWGRPSRELGDLGAFFRWNWGSGFSVHQVQVKSGVPLIFFRTPALSMSKGLWLCHAEIAQGVSLSLRPEFSSELKLGPRHCQERQS